MTRIPQRTRQPKGSLRSWLVFAGGLLLFAALNLWLLQQGYSSEADQLRWSKVLTTLDDKEFRIEHISLLYPHGPIYLLALMHGVFNINGVAASTWLSALIVALLFSVWNRHLRQKGYPFRVRSAFLLLLALHPFTLWAASSGLSNALSLLLFYLFCYACYLIIAIYDLRAMMMAAALLAVLFFADERAIFLFFALLPLIPLLTPPRLSNSLTGIYAILVFPLLVAVAGWMYLNWIFHNNAWAFMRATEGSFRGALDSAQTSIWLAAYGGQWWMPAALATIGAIVAFPLPVWLAWVYRRRYHKQAAACLALFIHPAIAISLATLTLFLEDLHTLLYLLVAVAMTCILLMPRTQRVWPMLLLLAIGNAGGWLILQRYAAPHNQQWLRAFSGQTAPASADPLVQLGLWLQENADETLLDDRALYRSIVARGHAHNLVLPFMHRFKNQMRQVAPSSRQVVVAKPNSPDAARDRVTQQFPDFFWEGAPGYRLSYDDGNWRVWQKPPPLVAKHQG